MKTAILYLRAPANLKDQQSVLVPQATALGHYCQENNIDVIEIFYEIDDEKAIDQPELHKMVKQIFDRKLKPDYLLFTTLDIFSNNISNALHLHHILAKFGVTTKAILQPNIIFASIKS